jgi:hypothetical protein
MGRTPATLCSIACSGCLRCACGNVRKEVGQGIARAAAFGWQELDQAASVCASEASSATSTLVTVVEAFSRVKGFAIDVLVWRDLNHHRVVRRSNVRLVHCLTSLYFAGRLRPRPSPRRAECGPGPREGMHLTQKPHAGGADNSSLTVSGALNDQRVPDELSACPKRVPAQCRSWSPVR